MTCNIPPPRTLRAHSEVRETVLTAQGLRVPDAYCLHTICLFPVILRGDCECWYAIATKSKKDRPKAITTAIRIGMIGLVIAGGLAYNVSGAERLGLVFYVLASVLISIDYVRGTVPRQNVLKLFCSFCRGWQRVLF